MEQDVATTTAYHRSKMIMNSHSKRRPDSEGSLYTWSSHHDSFPICSVYAPSQLRAPSLLPSLSSPIFPVENSISQNQHCCRSVAAPSLSGGRRRLTWELGHCLSSPSPSTCTSAAACVASDDVSRCKNGESSRDSFHFMRSSESMQFV